MSINLNFFLWKSSSFKKTLNFLKKNQLKKTFLIDSIRFCCLNHEKFSIFFLADTFVMKIVNKIKYQISIETSIPKYRTKKKSFNFLFNCKLTLMDSPKKTFLVYLKGFLTNFVNLLKLVI